VSTGIGTWGLNKKTVGWAWDIKFVWWWYWSRWNIDFCGTVIIPSLRMAINRSAEAMTYSL
jgi:hypothetical protein